MLIGATSPLAIILLSVILNNFMNSEIASDSHSGGMYAALERWANVCRNQNAALEK